MGHERFAFQSGVRVKDPKVTTVLILLWFADLSVLQWLILVAAKA
jgi:hypothetical protein